MIRMAEQLYLNRRQCTLSLTSNGSFVLDGSLVAKAKGSFGSQWKFMKKDFNKKFKHEGEREYNIMAILNTLDKAQNGDGGKHIVTVQNVPPSTREASRSLRRWLCVRSPSFSRIDHECLD